MASDEIGFPELIRLVRRNWLLILVVAALAGLATLAINTMVTPEIYQASARLVVHPVMLGTEGDTRSIDLYRSLLESDAILQRTGERLAEQGLITEETNLGPHLTLTNATAEAQAGGRSAILALNAQFENPETAAAAANTWAKVFIQESGAMLQTTAAQSESVLSGQLTPTREQLATLRAELAGQIDEIQARQESASATWDKRTMAATRAAETARAEYQLETRSLMDQVVSRALEDSPADILRARILDIVAVRAQLAQTPRLLDLEKAASDETLAELLAAGQRAKSFDVTVSSQEVNPLYAQLAMSALELENQLRSVATDRLAPVSQLLSELERIQLERGAGLVALLADSSLKMRGLRRRRGRNLEALEREEQRVRAAYRLEADSLENLHTSLAQGLNQSSISRLLESVDAVDLAAPAVALSQSLPRETYLKVAVAVFLGGMLGLMIALFRSVSTS